MRKWPHTGCLYSGDLCILFRIFSGVHSLYLICTGTLSRQKGCESTSEIHILFLWICRFCSCATLYPYLYILGYGSGACHHPALYFYHFQTDTALSFFPDYRPGALSRKEELETAYTASFITICFSAILMYYIERGAQPEVFKNIGDGIWWAIITFATVGYGDIYPVTPLGKLLGCIICLVGVAMVAIPTGIISSSFINIIQKKKRKFQNNNLTDFKLIIMMKKVF